MKDFTIVKKSEKKDFFKQRLSALVILLFFLGFQSWSQEECSPLDLEFSICVDGQPGDWNTLDQANPLTYSHIVDAFGSGVVDDQFTQGSKDFDFVEDLRWADGQTKNKNDIANAAGYLETVTYNGMEYTRLFFAGDRLSTNGDSQIGMWFYQGGVAPVEGGTFEGEHVAGDILALINFVGGGSTAEVEIYSWVDDGSGEYGNGNLDLEITGLHKAVQIQVGDFVPENWEFSSPEYEENQFFEGYIDLGALMLANEDIDFCFNRFLIEGRSSQSLTAALDDFANGELNIRPTVTVNSVAVCDGETATLIATPGSGSASDYNFHWKDPEGADIADDDESIDVTEPGDYTVTISYKVLAIDCESEEATGTVTVYDLPELEIDATNVTCSGAGDGAVLVPENDYSLVLYMSDSENGTYAEVPTPDTDAEGNFINLGAGWYYVEATESHEQEEGDPIECTADSNKVQIIDPTAVTLNTSSTNITCYGENDGSLTIVDDYTGTGFGDPTFYLKTDDGDFVEMTEAAIEAVTAAGDYVIKISYPDGTGEGVCEATSEESIIEPTEVTLNTSSTNITCNGENDGSLTIVDDYTGTGFGDPTFYLKTDGGDFVEMTEAAIEAVTAAGDYVIKISYPDGTGEGVCEATSEESIVEPTEVTLNTSSTNITCYGENDGSLTIVDDYTGTGFGDPTFYLKTDDGDFVEMTEAAIEAVTAAGDYVIKISYPDGTGEGVCEATSEESIIEPPLVSVSGTGYDPTCENLSGGYIDVTASGYDRLELWKDGVNTGLTDADLVGGSFIDLSAGNYVIKAFADGGNDEEDLCTAEDSVILTAPICDQEACTLGYWKNHTDRWCRVDDGDPGSDFIYETCDLYSEVFGIDFSAYGYDEFIGLTLLDALNTQGGGVYNLLRQSVAALLNICHDEVSYPYSGDLVTAVQEAFAEGSEGALASELDMINNMYPCPMEGSSATTASTCSNGEASSTAQAFTTQSVEKGDIILSPNPFRDVLTITYDFDYTSDVIIEVFSGQTLLRTFTDSNVTAGSSTEIDLGAYPSQMFVIRVITSQEVISKQASK